MTGHFSTSLGLVLFLSPLRAADKPRATEI
jgi:hypothetical protein